MERLTLIISTKCNMACSYCYAGGGGYHGAESVMDPTMASRVFDHFAAHFGQVGQVLYFGGEPLIGLKVMQKVCGHIRSLVEAGTLAGLPRFAVVTNGTLIARRPAFLSLAREFNFSVTISLDGPKDINNRTRIMKGGAGSFELVKSGILRLKRQHIPFSVECTYTPTHLSEGWLPDDLYEFFIGLGAEHVIIVEEMRPGTDNATNSSDFSRTMFPHWLRLFDHALEQWTHTDVMRLAGPEQVLGAMVMKPPLLAKRYCEGGTESFAVNPQGMVFPCHMLNNNESFCLGYYENVTGPGEVLPGKDQVAECASCPIKSYCRSCPARMYLQTRGKGFRPSPEQCDLNKASFLLALKALRTTEKEGPDTATRGFLLPSQGRESGG